MQRGGIFFVASLILLCGVSATQAEGIELSVRGAALSQGEQVGYYDAVTMRVVLDNAVSCDVFALFVSGSETTETPIASFDDGNGLLEWTPTVAQRSAPSTIQFVVRYVVDGLSKELKSSSFTYQWFDALSSSIEKNYEVCPGETLHVTPSVYGKDVTARWKRMGGGEYLSETATLSFNSLRREDAGWYSCDIISTNEQNEGVLIHSFDTYLHVYIMPDVVRITPDKEIQEGENLQLYCVIDEHSPTSIQWYKLDEPERILSTKKGLTIPQASVEDAGVYVFSAASDVCDWTYSTTVTIGILAQPAIDDITVTFPDCGALLTAHPNNVTFLQWYSKREGSIVELEGETKNSLYVANIGSGEQFFCIGSNEHGASVESKHVVVEPQHWEFSPTLVTAPVVELEVGESTQELFLESFAEETLMCVESFVLDITWEMEFIAIECAVPGVQLEFHSEGLSVRGDAVLLNEVLRNIEISSHAVGSTTVFSSLALVHHGGHLTQPQHLAVEVAVMAEHSKEDAETGLFEIPVVIHVVPQSDGGFAVECQVNDEHFNKGELKVFTYVGVELFSASASANTPTVVPAERVRSGGQFFVVYQSHGLQAVKSVVIQ